MAELITGLSSGAAYALMAVGVVLVFRCTRALSIAQGEIGAFGFFVGLRWADRGIPLLGWHPPRFATLLIAVVIGGLIGFVVERLVMRPLVSRPPLDALIATLGIALFLALLELRLFGTATQFAPSAVGEWKLELFGATLVASRVVGIVLAAGVAFALYVFFTRTKFGLAVQATTGDPTVARLLGVPVNQVYRFAWVAAGMLSGLAAALLGPAFGGLTPFGQTEFGLRALAGVGDRRTRLGERRDHRQPDRRRGRGVWQGLPRPGGRRPPGARARARHPDRAAQGALRCHRGSLISPRSASACGDALRQPARAATTAAIALAVLAPVLPGVRSSTLNILAGVAAIAIAALGLDVLVGRTGQLSLAHAAFVGVGAFATIGVGGRGAPWPLALVGGVVATAAIATIAGLPALRIRGLQVAIVTLALQLAAEKFVYPGRRRSPAPISRSTARRCWRRRSRCTTSPSHACAWCSSCAGGSASPAGDGRCWRSATSSCGPTRSGSSRDRPNWAPTRCRARSPAWPGPSSRSRRRPARSATPRPFALLQSLLLVAIVVVGGAGSGAGIVLAAAVSERHPADLHGSRP